jgi:hypothetical protein
MMSHCNGKLWSKHWSEFDRSFGKLDLFRTPRKKL